MIGVGSDKCVTKRDMEGKGMVVFQQMNVTLLYRGLFWAFEQLWGDDPKSGPFHSSLLAMCPYLFATICN